MAELPRAIEAFGQVFRHATALTPKYFEEILQAFRSRNGKLLSNAEFRLMDLKANLPEVEAKVSARSRDLTEVSMGCASSRMS